MFDLDKWQEIFNTIRKHKLRTGLTALGVFWGIFMLVLLMGAGKGLQNGVYSMFGGHAKNSMYMGGRFTTKPYKGLKPGRPIQLTNDDIKAIRTNFKDEIAYVAPRLWMPAGDVSRKNKHASFDVRGDAPDLLKIDAIFLTQGRFLNETDIEDRRKVAVLGDQARGLLFEESENPIGEYIRFKGIDYMVVGIVKSDRRGQDAMEDEKTVFIPITTAQQITNRPNRVGWFVCSMHPNIKVSSMEPKIKDLLKKRLNIAPDDDQAMWSDNIEEEFKNITNLFFSIRMLIWFVGIGSLLAGIIGVGNIMLIIVKERTKEIGIRKALGATPNSIVSMILLESVFLTTVAGYVGLACSTMIIWLMNVASGEGADFFTNPEVDFKVGLTALVILVISGALTGFIPAMQAAKVNPVVALKDE
ncbi:MAG: ABC transporter permease [Saprospiraceae bacterium]